MGKYVRDFLALGLAAIALGGGCVEDAQATGGDEEPRPKITLRVYNYARVPTPILVSAEGEAQKIFREVGVETEWLDCRLSAAGPRTPAYQRPLTTLDLILRLLPPSMAQTIAVQNNEVFGMALTVDGTPATDAFIFYQRVLDLARTGYIYEQEILAAAMAHEIGHLLLGSNSHSSTGIMRAKWNRDELELARLRRLLFTPDQSKLIRANVLARVQTRATGTTPTVTLQVYDYARVSASPLEVGKGAGRQSLPSGGDRDGLASLPLRAKGLPQPVRVLRDFGLRTQAGQNLNAEQSAIRCEYP